MAYPAHRIAAASIALFFAFALRAQSGAVATVGTTAGSSASVSVTTPPPVPTPPVTTFVPPFDPNIAVSPSGGGVTTQPPTTARATTPPVLFGISGGGSVELGQKVTLQVSISGAGTDADPELTYQWRRNGTNLAGAIATTYVIEATTAADSATYTIAVTNSAGTSVATTDVTVKAAAAPLITTQPRTTTASAGQTITFSFVATGSFPRTYQWRKDGTPLPGATDAALTLSAITTAQAGAYSVAVANALGAATSSPASLTVNAATPPVVSSGSPFDLTTTQGSSATLSSSLNGGSSPFTYQWLKNGVALPGATNSSLAFTAIALADAGRYSFTVTNPAGSATSREATLTVNPPSPINIFSHPQSQTLFQGQSLSLSISLNGSSPITYQWRKNGTDIVGATSGSFSINSAATADSGTYTVVVTNPAGSVTSNAAVVTINAPVAPTITTQPTNQNVAFNSSFSLGVQVSGSPPFTFSWRKDGGPATGSTSSGSSSSSYSQSSATPTHSGNYTVVVTNSAGSVTSNIASVAVTAAVLPTISSQPVDRQVAVGLSASLSIGFSSTGAGSVTVQWLKNGVPISGANSSSYSINSVKESDAGNYTVLLTGAAGSVTSATAKLTALPPSPPIVNSWPSDRSVSIGSSLSFAVGTPQGSGPFTFQWFKDGNLLPAVTGSSLSISSFNDSHVGSYFVIVSNDGGLIVSPPFKVVVQISSSSTPVPSPWIAATQFGNAIYFLATSPSRIERYDLGTDRWLPTVILSETQVPTAFLPVSEGVYVAYGRVLVRRSPDLATETPVANSVADISAMFAQDDFLFYNTSSSSSSSSSSLVLMSIRRSTLAAGPTGSVVFAQPTLASRSRRLFGTSVFGFEGLPARANIGADGHLTNSATASVSNYYPLPRSARVIVFPAEDLLANGAGTLFRTSDLTYAGSLGTSLTDLTFLADGTPIALRDQALQLLGAPGYIETGSATLPFAGLRAFGADSSVVVFGAAPTVGAPFRATRIARSAFLPPPVPTVSATSGERFSVEGIYSGSDGVVGILSRSRQALLRWSPVTRSYLTPVPLRGLPTLVSPSSSSSRILLAYADGVVTEVPVRATATNERSITVLGNRPWALTDLGDMLMVNVRNYSDSGDFRIIHGAQGQVLYTSIGAGLYFGAGAAWQSSTRRLYSNESFGSTGAVRYETVPLTGIPVTSNGQTSSGSAVASPPYRFNADGSLFASGNGRVFNAALAQVGILANNIVDADWLPSGLFTLRTSTNGDTEIQRWDRFTYFLSGTLTVRGTPQRILRVSDAQLLVISAIQGFLSFNLVNSDLSLSVPPGSPGAAGVYAGTLGGDGNAGVFSLYVRPDRTGVILIQPTRGTASLVATTVTLATDGSFVATGRTLDGSISRVIAGNITSGGTVSGSIPSLNLSLAGSKSVGSVFPAFYSAPAINGASGNSYAVVGEDGRALLVAQTSSASDGGTGTLGSDGKVTVETSSAGNLSATLNAASGGIVVTGNSGTFAGANFAGLREGVARNDRLANISTRGRAGPGDDLMIAGFVLSGTAPRPVLIRAIGPSLGAFGVPGTLADPRLSLYRGDTKISENDNWSATGDLPATTARLGGFALVAGSADSALLLTLDPGAYTAQVGAPDGAAGGTALVEVYDAGSTPTPGAPAPRLINIATRGRISTADDSLIAGIVVTGNAPKRLLIRAIGPGLAAFGVPGTLADPILTLTGPTAAGTGTLATNDDWSTPAANSATTAELAVAAVSVGAFALPANSRDACLLLTLAPGNYTAQVLGKNGATGIALVEVYEVNN